MAKVKYIDPIDHISGKISKHHESVYNYRSDIDCAYITQPRKSTVPPTADQLAMQEQFARTASRVKQAMSDQAQVSTYNEAFKQQTKYKTLRGYIFSQLYGQE